jgi:predicted metalloendopeptidase
VYPKVATPLAFVTMVAVCAFGPVIVTWTGKSAIGCPPESVRVATRLSAVPTTCVVSQYDAYPVLGTSHVDGRFTAGEDIADIAGLRLAHAVFRAEQAHSPRVTTSDDGLSDEQRFFVAFGQDWCAKRRDAYARLMVTIDVHAPPEYRVNGPVSDLSAFQDAFSCKAGAPMAPVHRCEVW